MNYLDELKNDYIVQGYGLLCNGGRYRVINAKSEKELIKLLLEYLTEYGLEPLISTDIFTKHRKFLERHHIYLNRSGELDALYLIGKEGDYIFRGNAMIVPVVKCNIELRGDSICYPKHPNISIKAYDNAVVIHGRKCNIELRDFSSLKGGSWNHVTCHDQSKAEILFGCEIEGYDYSEIDYVESDKCVIPFKPNNITLYGNSISRKEIPEDNDAITQGRKSLLLWENRLKEWYDNVSK